MKYALVNEMAVKPAGKGIISMVDEHGPEQTTFPSSIGIKINCNIIIFKNKSR